MSRNRHTSKSTESEHSSAATAPKGKMEKIRKMAEGVATFGMILIMVAIAAPLANLTSTAWLPIFKWIYAAGAVIFATARAVGSTDPKESMRLRRLRRLEFWAGVAFIIGGAFWFYNESRFSSVPSAGSLSILRETILFSLVGALIQVVASWLIYSVAKKEKSNSPGKPEE